MSLSDLASLGSFVSAIAVLISLVYLSLQVRQAEKNQRALMQQGRAERVGNNCLQVAEPGLCGVFNKGLRGDDTLSPEQFEQFMLIARSAFLSAEDSFLQHRSGQLDDAAFSSFVAGMKNSFSNRGLRAVWRMSSHHYGAEFTQFVEDIMREQPAAAPFDGRARWLDLVRSERSAA